ncbi:MAG TPA: transcription-repair coupling factor, partial [Ruminococcus sp.]|nr:transcription-repair coupling factor [Ruminococcus sp.]
MDILKSLFRELSGYKGIEEALKKNISPVSVTGLSHIHRVQLIYALENSEKISLAIAGSEAEAKKLCDDINQMAERECAVLFPSRELMLTYAEGASTEYEQMRISALTKAANSKCSVIVAGIEGVMQPTIPPDRLIDSIINIESGTELDISDLCRRLS